MISGSPASDGIIMAYGEGKAVDRAESGGESIHMNGPDGCAGDFGKREECADAWMETHLTQITRSVQMHAIRMVTALHGLMNMTGSVAGSNHMCQTCLGRIRRQW